MDHGGGSRGKERCPGSAYSIKVEPISFPHNGLSMGFKVSGIYEKKSHIGIHYFWPNEVINRERKG